MNFEALRISPHSIEAEQAVLGGLMLDANALDRVSDKLGEDDFYRKDHRLIWRAINNLAQRHMPLDPVTLGDWFEANGFADFMGGTSYLIDMANATPSAANIAAYADIVREKSLHRKIIDLSTRLTESAYEASGDSAELIDTGIANLMRMQRVHANSEWTLGQALSKAYEAAEAAKARGGAIPGIPTGLSKLDEVLGGWHNSDFVVIGARPSMGKTALLLNVALGGEVAGGLVSTEQPVVQIGSRLLAIEGGINASRLRNGSHDSNDLGKMSFAVQRLLERQLMISDRSAPTIADVQRMARRWRQNHGMKVLLVDYIQRIKGNDPRAKRVEQVVEVTEGLKDIARELDIPVVALAQVNREVDKRTDKRPGMGDLSDSSSIEKEADQIIMLYRDEVYNRDSADKGAAELLVEKNRHGPTGFVRVAWHAETMRFRDWAPDHYSADDFDV